MACASSTLESFLDEKSGGSQIHTSELATPEALERLLLIVAIATLHLTSIGAAVVQAGKHRWVDARLRSRLELPQNWLAVAAAAISARLAGVCSFLARVLLQIPFPFSTHVKTPSARVTTSLSQWLCKLSGF